jgi:hypothetical protein
MDSDFLRKHNWIFRVHHRVELKSDNGKSASTVTLQQFLVAGDVPLPRC